MSLSPTQIVAIIYIAFNGIVLAPYVAYQTYVYSAYRTKSQSPFILNRRPDMGLPFCVTCLFTVAVVMPISFGIEIFSEKEWGSESIAYYFVLISCATTMLIGIWRAWHVQFDIRHQMEASLMALNEHLGKEPSSRSDWYTRHVHTWGNSRWTRNRFAIMAVVASLALIPYHQKFEVTQGIVIGIMVVLFAILFVISWRLSKVKDEIMLRSEYIYISVLSTSFFIMFGIIYIFAHDWNNDDTISQEVMDDTLYLVLPSPLLHCVTLVQTQWVIHQYNSLERKQREMEANASKNGKLRVSVALKDVMADYEGYRILMEYLVKCVCSENLLYVTEALQFMKDLSERYQVEPATIQAQNYLDSYAIPNTLPQSRIMTEFEATSSRFLRICEKYILEQAEFEINISHKNRKNLTVLYRQLESKVNEMNPRMRKLRNMFGDESKRSVSRRASQTASSRMMLENSKERIQRKLSRDKSQSNPELRSVTPSPTADFVNGGLDGGSGSGSKLSHQCIQDYQLLSQDEIVQEIYDCLCATLGDVYSNLNDAGMRFMQTDVYFRWYDHNINDNDRKEGIGMKQSFVALQAAIRRNTENPDVPPSSNGSATTDDQDDSPNPEKLNVLAAPLSTETPSSKELHSESELH